MGETVSQLVMVGHLDPAKWRWKLISLVGGPGVFNPIHTSDPSLDSQSNMPTTHFAPQYQLAAVDVMTPAPKDLENAIGLTTDQRYMMLNQRNTENSNKRNIYEK